MICGSPGSASRPCRLPPNWSATKAMTATIYAPGWLRAAPPRSSRPRSTAKSNSTRSDNLQVAQRHRTHVLPLQGLEACRHALRPQHQNLHGNHRHRCYRHLVALMGPDPNRRWQPFLRFGSGIAGRRGCSACREIRRPQDGQAASNRAWGLASCLPLNPFIFGQFWMNT